MKSSKYHSYLILFVLFSISVLIRLPHLNRPLSKHHEFNAALISIPMDIWEQTESKEHYYSPIMNFQNEGDRNINNVTIEGIQKNGNFYYLSFPCLTYLLPYSVFNLFGIGHSPLALQCFNLLTHLICIILIFKIILFVTSSDSSPLWKSKKVALLTAAIFTFSPTPLWFYGNGYTHHTLVQVFILWNILTILKMTFSTRPISMVQWITLFTSLTLAILTTWTGHLLAFILFCYSILLWYRGNKIYIRISIVALTSVFVGSALTFWQYSSVVGADIYLGYLYDRFFDRSGLSMGFITSTAHLIFAIGKWYIIGYLPILILILFQLKIARFQFSQKERTFLTIMLILTFSHHFLLGEFTTAHNYSVLIDGVLIAGIASILMLRIIEKGKHSKLMLFMVVFVIAGSIGQYYYINRVGQYGQNGDRYDAMKNIGETIKNNSSSEDVIFVQNLLDKPATQVMYYSKRNFHHVHNRDTVMQLMIKSNLKQGKLFVISDQEVVKIQNIRTSSSSIDFQTDFEQ